MNPGDLGQEEFSRLVSRLLDGQLSPDERALLEVQIETDAEARRLYVQMVDQEIELECLAVPETHGAIARLADAFERRDAKAAANRRWWRMAAVAALIAILAVLWLGPKPWETPATELAQNSTPSETAPRADQRPVEPAAFAYGHWEEDFESGVAPRWIGEIVSSDLPAGSRHGLRVARQISPGDVQYQIVPPADWDRGLFALTERSTLHITYRLGRPAWMNVFMHTNPADPAVGRVSMFQLTGSQFPGASGQWQTASIPFAKFVRKIVDSTTGALEFSGGPPETGEIVTAFAITAPHEFDLVVDRIWVTPDGTGTETFVPFP